MPGQGFGCGSVLVTLRSWGGAEPELSLGQEGALREPVMPRHGAVNPKLETDSFGSTFPWAGQGPASCNPASPPSWKSGGQQQIYELLWRVLGGAVFRCVHLAETGEMSRAAS